MRVNVWSFITTETLVLSRKWLAAVIETAGTNDTNIKIPGVSWRVCNMDFYGVYICLVDRECQWCVNFAAGAVQERANQCSQGKKGDSTWATEMTFNCTWAVGLYWYMYASMKNKSIMAFSASGAIKGSVSDSTYWKHTDQKSIQIFLSFFFVLVFIVFCAFCWLPGTHAYSFTLTRECNAFDFETLLYHNTCPLSGLFSCW